MNGWFPTVNTSIKNTKNVSIGFNNKRSGFTRSDVWTNWDRTLKVRAFESLAFLAIINYVTSLFIEGDEVIKEYDYDSFQWTQLKDLRARKLMRLFRCPNKDVGKFSHIYNILYNYYAKGIAFNKIEFDGNMQPTNFISIDPNDVNLIYDDVTGVFSKIRVGSNRALDKDQFVVYRKGLANNDLNTGIGLEKYAKFALGLDKSSTHLAYFLCEQLGIEVPIISPKDGLEFIETDAKEIKDFYKKGTTGFNRGDPLISPYPIDIKMVGAKIMDLDTRQLFFACVQKVCSMFPIDPILLGLGEPNAAYNSQNSAKSICYETLIIPLQNIIYGQATEQLLPFFYVDWKDYKVCINNNNVMAVTSQRATIITSVANGYKTKLFDRATAKRFLGEPYTNEDVGVYFTINQVQILNTDDPDQEALGLIKENDKTTTKSK